MDRIVDQSTWLFNQIERLIANDESSSSAEVYLEKLLKITNSPFQKAYCLRHLGRFAAARKDLANAEKYLKSALSLETDDPEILFLIGETASETGTWWFALLHYFHALQQATEDSNQLEIMRGIARAFQKLNFGEVALSVLLGALERNPEDPFILSALEHFYETREEWTKAQDIGITLVELMDRYPSISFDKGEEVKKRLTHISSQLQSQLRLVDENDVNIGGDLTMVSSDFGPGLNTLVNMLSIKTRNAPLLESAKALWAKSADIKYDSYFSTATLAAAIHWIVEKLHWRMPTSIGDLEVIYGVDREQMLAAVRILVAQFQVSFFPDAAAREALGPRELEELRKIQKSFFFGSEKHEELE